MDWGLDWILEGMGGYHFLEKFKTLYKHRITVYCTTDGDVGNQIFGDVKWKG